MVKDLKETELNNDNELEVDNLRDKIENDSDNNEILGVKELKPYKSLLSNYYLVFYILCLVYSIYIYFAPVTIEFVLDGVNSTGLAIFILNIISRMSAKWLWVLSLFGLFLSFFKKTFSDFVKWYTVFVVTVIMGSIISLIL